MCAKFGTIFITIPGRHFNGVSKVSHCAVIDLRPWPLAYVQTAVRNGGHTPQRYVAVLCLLDPASAYRPDANWRGFYGTHTRTRSSWHSITSSINIEHRRTCVCTLQTNGYVARFPRTMQADFFGEAQHTVCNKIVATLPTGLDAWLVSYNTKRSYADYCIIWHRPITTVN